MTAGQIASPAAEDWPVGTTGATPPQRRGWWCAAPARKPATSHTSSSTQDVAQNRRGYNLVAISPAGALLRARFSTHQATMQPLAPWRVGWNSGRPARSSPAPSPTRGNPQAKRRGGGCVATRRCFHRSAGQAAVGPCVCRRCRCGAGRIAETKRPAASGGGCRRFARGWGRSFRRIAPVTIRQSN